MNSSPWKGKTAIICGASSGLGRSLACNLAQQSAKRLVLVARTPEPLANLARDLSQRDPTLNISVHSLDLQHREEVEALVVKLKQQNLQADIVIQAAGLSDRGTLQTLSSSRLQELLQANLSTSLNALQCFQPLVTSPGGVFVFIGSLASIFTPRFIGGYAIAKHALAGMAGQARMELAEVGVHVLLACPGPIARPDAGTRYNALSQPSDLPDAALQPGGGAKLKGLDVRRLAQDILLAAHRRQPELIRPRKARLLHILSAISPRIGDWYLRKQTS
ncbi:SDR family NAD(P)-dependent oxidoreductase [Aureliella helgolandensis]|uniref:Putative oxidoreductase n=1 Tax=Aureliella helgolandensis TaxID=2527968 RepID=A0A518GGR0_9BACT|nr:SDR family NAD(P)-dependent oxidoreductase [Aureliella helgolandensis]QDV27779.1 putative oxidoreductase [Aureliella helgolandensis]